jgi:Gram-negative bacterial TonB protein C-terminal/PilZ domain
MLHAPQNEEHGLKLAERRVRARIEPASLIFVRLDEHNGGIVLNLSEDGLALSAIKSVPDGELPALRIQFPESPNWIPASAQVVWRSESRKEIGIRFAALTEEARRQINGWIATQVSLGESREERDVPGKEQCPLYPGADETSSDSSPVPVIPGEVTRVQAQNAGIPANPEAISDEPTSGFAEQAKQLAEDGPPTPRQSRTSSAHPDRRARPRVPIVPLGYLQLGEGNGGIALNVSEDGLAITAAVILSDDHLPSIRLLFPDSDDWIEASGQVVWRSESKKEAGVRFAGLTEQARQQIRNWMSSQAPLCEVPNQIDQSSYKHELPSVIEDAPALPDPIGRNEDPFFPPMPLPALPDENLPIPVPDFAPIGEHSDRWASQFVLKLADDPRKVVALAALVAFLLLIPVSMVLRHHVRDEMMTSSVDKTSVSRNLDKSSPSPPASWIPSASRPEVEASNRSEPGPEPPSTGKNESIIHPSVNTPQPPVPPMTGPSTGTASKPPSHATANAVAPAREVKEPTNIADWTNSHPVEKAQPKADSSQPPAMPQLENSVASLANSSSNPLKSAPFVELAKKEPPPVLPKQPETPANRSGTVEIMADPYPSIRTPPEHKSKKTPKGNSLQLGRLISRVEPVYPEGAKQQGIEGTVKLHAIIGRDGTVQQVQADGPPVFVPVATSAVRQWRYSQTLLGGQPVETEENIGITFRLSHN